MTTEEIVSNVCQILDDSKADNIKVIAVTDQTSVADYFVVCSSRSVPHVKAIAENLVEKMDKDKGVDALHTDGMRSGKWALVDYGSVMVHVFEQGTRMYYGIENLWGNGENVKSFPEA